MLASHKNIATYNIIAKQEVAIIIQLFSIFNLNSNKHLNFLAFKEAFLRACAKIAQMTTLTAPLPPILGDEDASLEGRNLWYR